MKLPKKILRLKERYSNLNKSRFVGQQFSRLRMGQTYYSIIVSTMSAISLVTMAFNLDLWLLMILFPLIIAATFGIGIFLDRKDINLEDYRKQIEMQSRKLNVADLKSQEFQLMQTLFIIKALRDEVNEENLIESYKKYLKKWS
ncbi:MAG: hypothetical protein ACTSRW_01135 [Candidatus Helarchaeota archaeon]